MKRDGSFRCCVDYMGVNQVPRKDANPLPRTDKCLDAITDAQWLSTLNLRSSYKTTLICRDGSFRFITMPFAL